MASMMYQQLPQIVGVVGAGQMGSGIAQIVATRGLQVILTDRTHEALEKGLGYIKKSIEKVVRKGSLSDVDATMALTKIHTTTNYEEFKDADFVIEAVSENEELKRSIFKQLDHVTPLHAILASNTSSISITRLAAATTKPHRVIGMHFMNPVPLMQLVEIAKGMHTSQQTYDVTKSFGEFLRKQVCVSEDRPGFIVNRVLMPMVNEAFFCLMEGLASADDIDKGMKLGTNMPMGPLKLADFIGLDTCLSILKVLHTGLGDPKYRPCPLLVQYVDAGWLGVKTGQGVYHYDAALHDKEGKTHQGVGTPMVP